METLISIFPDSVNFIALDWIPSKTWQTLSWSVHTSGLLSPREASDSD